jgi:hypothetical protein
VCTDTHNGGVLCTDSLTEQHEHQTQGRGSVCTDSESNMNTKPRGEVAVFKLLCESVCTHYPSPVSLSVHTTPPL